MILGVSCGAMLAGNELAARVASTSADFYAPLETFSQVLFRVQQNYVEDRPARDLIEGAIDGMLGTLDPFSLYLDPDQYKAFQEDTRGQYFGIGVQIDAEPEALVVVAPFPGQPADLAGLKAGDRITSVDGTSVKQLGPDGAVERIKGRKGTKVVLTIERKDWDKPRDMEVVRDEIHTPSVRADMLEPGYGFVRLSQFTDGCAADVRDAIKQLSEAGPLKGVVIDLRGNPGGLLDEAVQMVDLFVEEGTIVSTRGRTENEVDTARRSGTLEPFQITVLINGGSASASEIVAGALQDLDRATIAGEPSYGKGSVQNIFPLADQSALRLTVARYYTPSGRPIDREHPVTPDITLPAPEGVDEGFEGGLDWLTGDALKRALADDVQVQGALKLLHERVASAEKPAGQP